MDYYKKNLELLKQKDKELAKKLEIVEIDNSIHIIQSKSLLPTIEVNQNGKKILLHSLYNPQKEAETLISNYNFDKTALVITFGLALGYHIDEIIKRINKNTYLWIVEKDMRIFKVAMQMRDLSFILNRDRTELLIDKINFENLFHLIRKVYHPVFPYDSKLVFVNHPATIQRQPNYYKNLTIQIRDAVSVFTVLVNTTTFVGPKWTKNILLNIDECFKNQPIKKLFNKFENKPAIVVAAGPSLDKNIDELKLIKNNAIIIAVGTSLRPLLKRGIKPHLVVAIDADAAHYKHFAGINNTDDIPLVCDTMIYPQILQEYKGPRLIADVTHQPIKEWISEYVGNYGALSTGFSVATSAFSLAKELGCSPIILVGQDLSFKETGQTHVTGSSYDDMRADFNNPNLLKVPGNIEKEVITTPVFLSTIKWFEENIAQYPGLCINATEGGARIEGAKLMSLREAIEKYCKEEFDTTCIMDIANEKHTISNKKINKLKQEFEKILKKLKKFYQQSEKGLELANKLLERFSEIKERTEEINSMAYELQLIIDKIRSEHKTISLLEPWLQQVYFLLYKTQDEFRELEGEPLIIKETNRGGIFLDAINEVCKEVIPLVEVALEKLDKLTINH